MLPEVNCKKLHSRNCITEALTPSVAAGIFHINIPCKFLADVTDLTLLINAAMSLRFCNYRSLPSL